MQTKETIAEFHEQWLKYQHTGISATITYFDDVVGPLIDCQALAGKSVADIGAGNGRFTEALAQHAGKVLSIEPAPGAMANNRQRNARYVNVEFLEAKSEQLPELHTMDDVFCIGVLHHIPDMEQALRGMLRLLKPGGHIVMWVYGLEGNRLYIYGIREPLKWLTTRMPDTWLQTLAKWLVAPVKAYMRLCQAKRWGTYLPMSEYFKRVISILHEKEIELMIFDQLNPSTARYLSKMDIIRLFRKVGIEDLAFYHRHGYSWTVKARVI